MLRLRLVWGVTFAFIPLYVWVGWVLRTGDADLGFWTPIYALIATAFGCIALLGRPIFGRMGLPYGTAALLTWYAAEAIAIFGLLRFIAGESAATFSVFAIASAFVMCLLFPRETLMRAHNAALPSAPAAHPE